MEEKGDVVVYLPVIDLSAPDRFATASSIRQACIDFGFFYIVNHGLHKDDFSELFDESQKFFSLPLEERMKLVKRQHRGYTALYSEKLDPSSSAEGDLKESFYVGPRHNEECDLNQWPSKEGDGGLNWQVKDEDGDQAGRRWWMKMEDEDEDEDGGGRIWWMTMEDEDRGRRWRTKIVDDDGGRRSWTTMEDEMVMMMDEDGGRRWMTMEMGSSGRSLLSLIALALNLDDKFFENMGVLDKPMGYLRLLHYPGDSHCSEEILGASAHSDYGMITLLATDGVPGLQVCRNKDRQPRIWENVPHIEGALIVNIGDMMERWTNCLFRSTLHRVIPTGQERYSAAFFFDPPEDLMVECIESCRSVSNPPRYPPIRSGDYLRERLRLTYS